MVAMRNLMAAAVHSSVWAYACVKFYQQAQGILVYVPCNDEPCVYYNFFDRKLPVADSFVLGRNGHGWEAGPGVEERGRVNVTGLITKLPLTMNATRCETQDMKNKIHQRLQGSLSGYGFLASVLLKSLFDFLHDALLLCGAGEHRSIESSCASFFFCGLTCMFSLSMGSMMAEVFVAMEGSSACIYQLGTFDSILGVAAPAFFVLHFLQRYQKLLKAATFGDYLFYWTGEVPYRVLHMNADAGDTSSLPDDLLVTSSIGDAPPGLRIDDGSTATYLKGVPTLPPFSTISEAWRRSDSSGALPSRFFWAFFTLYQMGLFVKNVGRHVTSSVSVDDAIMLLNVFMLLPLTVLLSSGKLTQEGNFLLTCTWGCMCSLCIVANFLLPVLVRGTFYCLRFIIGSLPLNVVNVARVELACRMSGPLLRLYVIYIAFSFCTKKHAGKAGTLFKWQHSEVEGKEVEDTERVEHTANGPQLLADGAPSDVGRDER